jgi:hypothetical protein
VFKRFPRYNQQVVFGGTKYFTNFYVEIVSLETFSNIQTTTTGELEQLLAKDNTSLEVGLGANHNIIGMTSLGASNIL